MAENTSIIVAGNGFDCGCRVVLWNEEGGLSFYPTKKFVSRNFSLAQLRAKINSFYIHHTVSYLAYSTFGGLKARGLSVNFLIDDDVNEDGCATIYQALDVKDAAYSQGGTYNHNGSGCEVCYFPDAWDHPDRYSEYNRKKWGVQEHKIVSDKVNGYVFKKVFAPTDAQVKACICLISGYKKAFPDLVLKFPRDENGVFLSKTVNETKKYGLLHHFNVTNRKIDALGFPTDYVEQEVNRIHNQSLENITEELPIQKTFLNKILDGLNNG
jgi:hypothetical protein